MINNVTLVGRLTKNPELRYIPGTKTAVSTFTIAVNRNYKNKDGSTSTDFIPVEVVGKTAEFCYNYLSKGRLIGVQGSIRVDNYETNTGEKRTFTKVNAATVQALESRHSDNQPNDMGMGLQSGNSAPTFEPSGVVDASEFSAVEDDDVPF